MNPVTAEGIVAPEEVLRRIAEYRRIGYERLLPAQVVYQGASVGCPWPGCVCHIAGIRFELATLGSDKQVAHWLAAWWTGSGLVGRCPGCGRQVLFELTRKSAVAEPASGPGVLPANWYRTAHLITGAA